MDYTFFQQVGNNIQMCLQEQGKTQQELATELGISKQVMSKIILGLKAINVEEVKRIAAQLGVTVEQLLTERPVPELAHNFSFMGQITNEKTREQLEFLKTVIDEIIVLEDYANES